MFVEEVQLTLANGFVVVCSLDGNQLLGFHRIARSPRERSLRVTLTERLTTRTPLLVELYADDGDNSFDANTDSRVSGDDDDITDLEVERIIYRYSG